MIFQLASSPETLASASAAVKLVTESPTVLLYVGPDQLMPLTSIFGAIVGVALMFWHRLVGWGRKGWMFVTKRTGKQDEPASRPVD